jgi:hypothetical protein
VNSIALSVAMVSARSTTPDIEPEQSMAIATFKKSNINNKKFHYLFNG